MKRTKKLLALALVLMMSFSIMAVTALAYGAEDGHVHTEACSESEITPRGAVRPCTWYGCDGTMELGKAPSPWDHTPTDAYICNKNSNHIDWV